LILRKEKYDSLTHQQGYAEGKAYNGKTKREWYSKGFAGGRVEEKRLWLEAIETQRMDKDEEELKNMLKISTNQILDAVINVHDNTIDTLTKDNI
jgi:hypothetical protein